jgi:hypothetical protein
VTLGPSGGTEVAEAVEPRTLRSVTIPAAAFSPTQESWDFSNPGFQLTLHGGSGGFVAPLYFPVSPVTIRKVTLYAYDNHTTYDVCVTLYRSKPATATEDEMVQVCSDGSSATRPREFSDGTFSPRRVLMRHGPYLQLTIPAAVYLDFYGVKITYGY